MKTSMKTTTTISTTVRTADIATTTAGRGDMAIGGGEGGFIQRN